MSESGARRAYLVECYWPSAHAEEVTASARRTRVAARELRRKGHRLLFLGSILVPADETVFYLFDGAEADVRAATERAGVRFERVVESLRMGGDTPDREER